MRRLRSRAGQRQIERPVAVYVGPLHAVTRRERQQVVRRHLGEGGTSGLRGAHEQIVPKALRGRHRAVHVQIEQAVVIDVGEGTGIVSTVDRHAPGRAHVAERAVGGPKKQAIRSVVGREQIGHAIVVHVSDAGPYGALRGDLRTASSPRQTDCLRDIGEGAAVVAEEAVGITILIRHVQIEIAILLVVEPNSTYTLPRIGQPNTRCDISEHAGAVAIQHVGAITKRHEQIKVTVAIDIEESRLTHCAGLYRQPTGRRDIGESRTVVAVQA